MHDEGVIHIEHSLSKTITFTPESVVVSDLNYDFFKEIKVLLVAHNNQGVDIILFSQHITTL